MDLYSTKFESSNAEISLISLFEISYNGVGNFCNYSNENLTLCFETILTKS